VAGKDPADKRWHLSTPAIGALIAAVSGAVTLAFTLSPSLAPDPGNAISAELHVVRVEPHAAYRSWARRVGYDGPRASADLLSQRDGFIVYLQLQVIGRKRHDLNLRKATYLSDRRTRWENFPPEVAFQSETPNDRWVASLFVPSPGLHKRFFVRYELYDRHVMLAVADTPALPGGA
jgi:hypothetical protein